MKRTHLSLLACAVMTGSSWAQAEITGNLGLTSNYVWRGLTQSSNNPALQGGLDYTHEDTGFYTGMWGSSGDFAGNLEVDFYGGMSGETDFELGWDAGLIYYTYPGTPDASRGGSDDILEGYAGVTYKFAKFSVYYNENSDTYLDASLNYDLPEEFRLGGHVGQSIWDEETNNPNGDYADYSVTLGRALGNGFDMSLMVSSTNTSVEDSGAKDDKVRFSATVTKEL
jgi:uncharacterized protein (TIGR02001 family)